MLDRTLPPAFAQSTTFDLIRPDQRTLSNGASVYLIGGGMQEVLKIELIFRAGKWYESRNGASHFAANLLTKGTRSRNSYQIAQVFDKFGAHVDIHPGFDHISVSVYTLTQFVKPVLELFTEILTQPEFPDREIEQFKSIFIQNLRVNEEKTSFLASREFRKRLFGEHHPYGKDVRQADASEITRAAIQSHFESFFHAPIALASGKLDERIHSEIIESVEAFTPSRPDDAAHAPATTTLFNENIDKEGSVQASIRMGKRSVKRSDPDYNHAVFCAHILGGYFGSRLMKNIREEKGLTYGIYSSIHPLRHDSFMLIGADVNKDKVGLTVDEIRKEIRMLRTEPVDPEELDTARNHFIGSLQAEITTPFAHADKIKTIILSGLSDDFYQKMINDVVQMTPEDIMRVMETHFHEDSLSTVSVG